MPFDKSISKLDLRNNQLRRIPDEVFKLKNLRKLDLRNNKIKSLPIELNRLTRLEILDLSYNEIQYLYAGLFKLKNLKILILSYNKLKALPRQISNLSKLQILLVSNNNLESLPDELGSLSSLQQINIARNKFSEFPQVILKLPNLRAIWINSNNFKTFPSQEINRKLQNLKSLYCFGFPSIKQTDKNSDYLTLSKIRGNTISQLKKKVLASPKKVIIPSKQIIVRKPPGKTKIFISYSRTDSEWLARVKTHLKSLNFETNKLEVWDDTRILAGAKWKEEITNALEDCRIAILIISAYFLASDFIINEELPTLLHNAETNGTKILPLIIYPCRFLNNRSLSQFQAVNDPKNPLSKLTLSEQEEILLKLTNDVELYLD